MKGLPRRPGVASGEVEAFPPDLLGAQDEELLRRSRLDLMQGADQADQGTVQDIVGFGPPGDGGEVPEGSLGDTF
jgi:hypothetical protein